MALLSKHLTTLLETENRLCALPDDLLLRIFRFVPANDAVATPILSKRWRYVWRTLPELVFEDQGSESFGWLVDKTLQLHDSPKLSRLDVELGPCCNSVDVDVGKWVEKAVKGGVKRLDFDLRWNKADLTSFPKSLYTCETLVALTLSNEILVDVSSPACLPSLLYLDLNDVVYKDEDSLVKLLSSCHVLKCLYVYRHEDDNLKDITVKVSSLETLDYKAKTRRHKEDVKAGAEGEGEGEGEVEGEGEGEGQGDLNGSLVIDCPALTELEISDTVGNYCFIENMPCLDVAEISLAHHNFCDSFLRSLSSVIHLNLYLTESMVASCYNAMKFSRLIELYFIPDNYVDWLEPLMFLLQNSPKLQSLTIDTNTGVVPPSWNQPSCIPGCLSSHLDIFGWRGYEGREDEKQLVTYILANSKCLKTVEISFRPPSNPEEIRQKEIESMPRISTSSQLLFPTQMIWRFNGLSDD